MRGEGPVVQVLRLKRAVQQRPNEEPVDQFLVAAAILLGLRARIAGIAIQPIELIKVHPRK
ncbi:MAG: hypothetical protein KJ749_08125, partial [Planctomycetes bacterium]|nr:hypothetical protein [Planctomycetota bacterium]